MKTNLTNWTPLNNNHLGQGQFRKIETLWDPEGQEHLPLRDGGDGYILDETLSKCVQHLYANKHNYTYVQARALFATMAQLCSKEGVNDDLCDEWFQYNCLRWAGKIVA